MLTKIDLGAYLERDVYYFHMETLQDWDQKIVLNGSTVLLKNNNGDFTQAQQMAFFKNVIEKEPLLISVSGDDADRKFDLILEILSTSKSTNQILTKCLDEGSLDEWVENFIKSSWPAEERMDDWVNYTIIELGHATQLKEIELCEKKII